MRVTAPTPQPKSATHAGLKTGLEEDAAAGGSVDIVKDEEPTDGRRSAGERIRHDAISCFRYRSYLSPRQNTRRGTEML
jgi:hypothetical protein